MIGFRPGLLTTQDVILLIRQHAAYTGQPGAYASDSKKVFDRVAHRAVLEVLRALGLGNRLFSVTRSFLNSRQASLKLGELKEKENSLGCRSTPQGALLSPLLW